MDKLTGFDIVAAFSENTINGQLVLLTNQKKIHPPEKPIEMRGFFSATLDIKKIGYPQVIFNPENPSYKDLILVLEFKKGTFTAGSYTCSINGWKFAFQTNMSLADIPFSHISENPHTTKEAAKSIQQKAQSLIGKKVVDIDKIFDIQYLFMNFEDANLAQYNKKHSSFHFKDLKDTSTGKIITDQSVKESMKTQFASLLTQWLDTKKGSKNPWILGYALNPKSKIDVPESDLPTFYPTNATFSTFPANKGLGTLNWLFVTNSKGKLPTDKRAGIFEKPWLTDNKTQGIMALDRQLVVRKHMLSPLADSFNLTVKDFKDHGTYFEIKNAAVEHLKDRGDKEYSKLNGGKVSMKVQHKAGGNEVTVDYTYIKSQEVKLGALELAKYTLTATWSMTFFFRIDAHGKISTTHKVSEIQKSVDAKKEWWQYLLDFLPGVSIAEMAITIGTLNQFPNVDQGVWNVADNKLTLILPGGEIFAFKDAKFDKEGNLLTTLAYSS